MSKNVNLQTFFDCAPSADEIDYHISNDPVFWNTATPSEAIEAIKKSAPIGSKGFKIVNYDR